VNTGPDIVVEVVYALQEQQELIEIRVPVGTSVADAIQRSGIADRFPGEQLDDCPTGIWGRPVGRGEPVRNGDRVELYRPLQKDPRVARRELAARGRAMGGKAVLKDRD